MAPKLFASLMMTFLVFLLKILNFHIPAKACKGESYDQFVGFNLLVSNK